MDDKTQWLLRAVALSPPSANQVQQPQTLKIGINTWLREMAIRGLGYLDCSKIDFDKNPRAYVAFSRAQSRTFNGCLRRLGAPKIRIS